VAERRKAMQERIDELDREAFRLGYELQSMNAMLAAVQKWVVDTRGQRKGTAADEKAFQERVRTEQQSSRALEKEISALRAELADSRAKVDTSIAGACHPRTPRRHRQAQRGGQSRTPGARAEEGR
jgi:uncharacterized protein YlxW (UPF0749 family)